MQYGAPYMGSKNAVARWVIQNLPRGSRLVDLFAGGCAVTHAAMLSGKWERFLVNDIGTAHLLFRDAIEGKLKGRTEWVSRELFFMTKETDPFIKYAWSFGNGGESYLYSRELEPYKRAVHMELTAPTLHERHMWHRKAARLGAALVGKTSLASLASLESLERLASLERLERLERLEMAQLDYRAVPLEPGDVIYCDIPYRGTGAKYCKGFDHEAFYSWAEETGKRFPVFISEYWMPEDRFECIAETTRVGHLSAINNANYKTERIFTPKTNRRVICSPST